jgi:hypothetical protein
LTNANLLTFLLAKVLLLGTYLFTGPSETSSVLNNADFKLEGSAFAAAG